MTGCLGIDTSNYTTSAALYFRETREIVQAKRLLPVKAGERGLRQSDAVFHHTVQLPEVMTSLFEKAGKCAISSIGVSVSPRDADGSYMPCFLTGISVAKSLSAAMGIPLYTFSHQAGHIAAALYSAGRTELFGQAFIAFHVSGGTTEALLVRPGKERVFDITCIGASSDLKAGQAVDRVGVLLGLPFPCGAALDELSRQSDKTYKIRPSVKGFNCSLSGIENQCKKRIADGEAPQDIAKFCIQSVLVNLEAMTENIRGDYPDLPLVYSGGVMSNSMIRAHFSEKFGASFAEPAFSSDNAAGIAYLTAMTSE